MSIAEIQPDKVRVPSAAKHYDVSVPAIWNWLRLGKITRFKLGAVTLVSLREMEELIEQGTAAAASEEAKRARIADAERRVKKTTDRAKKAAGKAA